MRDWRTHHPASSHDRFLVLLSHFQSLDNGPVESVQLPLKAAIFPPTTILLSYINGHRLARLLQSLGLISKRREVEGDRGCTFHIIGASMPVYALQIIAITAKFARRHAAYIFERRHLVLVGFVEMVVGTWIVRTVAS